MKIEFNETEVESLPEEVRQKLEDNVFDGDPLDFIPDVDGLKKSLEAVREDKRKAELVIKTIAGKFNAKKSDVMSAVDDFIQNNGDAGEVRKQLADERMMTEIARAGGNLDILPAVIRERVVWDGGQYVVPAEDGEPLKKDDGSLQGVADVVAELKANESFGNLFAARVHSGTGSSPQKAGDGPSGLAIDDNRSEAPAYDTPQKTMTPKQRRLAATVGGGLERYPS